MSIFEHGVYLMSFGKNFRQLREEVLKLKQFQLAEIMGCSRHHIGRVEKDEAEYTFSQIRALEEETSFSIADLLELSMASPPWLQDYLELNPTNRRKFDAIMHTAAQVLK